MRVVKNKKNNNQMGHVRKAISKTSATSTDAAALRQANKIVKAVGEAQEIHEGRKKGKSFDQFLKEL